MKTLLAITLTLTLAACGDDDAPVDAGNDATGEDAAPAEDSGPEDAGTMACEPVVPPCEDEHVLSLNLFDTVNDDPVSNEAVGDGSWRSVISAEGGGFMPTKGFVYVRFTDEGLAPVLVDDLDALESTEWDLAARRFVLRVNSGSAGPSCVTVARTAPGTEIDGLTRVPEMLSPPRTEEYMSASCMLVPDTSGLGSAATALSSFWSYPGCVQMTGNVYVLQLASGRHVALEVETYYTPEAQQACQDTGSAPMPNGAGRIGLRWRWLEG